MSGLDALLFTLVAALATWQAIEIWRHGSIFHDWRARLEAREEGFFTDLLLCAFCLSPWVGTLSVIAVFSLAFGSDNFEWHYLAAVPFLGLAAARLANLLNDLGRPYCRTPNRTDPEVEDLENMAVDPHAGRDETPDKPT